MDFTQIMQRYTRLRERFEQGEIDADSFEQQVNGMIYKDQEGRYWQIGVQSGLWYYYDGSKWVQDDLVEEIDEVEELPEAEPDLEMAAIDEIFPISDEEEEAEEPSPFDMAFEEQLASQFAESSDSQAFDLFEDKDIFASILKGKSLEDEADDPLAAPAEEVEELKRHLDVTQPVSIESLMGEGTTITDDEDGDQLDFLFGDSDDDYPEVEEGSDVDLAAVLGAFHQNDAEANFPDTDVREVAEKDVVTGELNMPAEPLTEDAIQALMDSAEEESELEEDDTDQNPEQSSEEEDDLVWELEPAEFQPFDGQIPEVEDNPMIEMLDDDFSIDDLVADSQQAYLESTQPVPAEVEFYDGSESEDTSSEEESPFEIPVQPPSQEINTVPAEVSAPVGETMQSARPMRTKRKLPMWVILLIIFVGVFVVVISLLLGWNLLRSMTGDDTSHTISVDDPNTHYENFEDNTSGWPELNDYTSGVTGYSSGFYYLYSIVPETPTIATVKSLYPDVVIDVETTQLNENSETLSTYGVMCRVQENGDGYAFRITNNGQYVIEKFEGGVFYPLNGWKYSDVIKANKEVNRNHLEVGCIGNQLTITVNGHLLDLAVDSSFTDGKVGFVAQAGDAEHETEVHYDELYLVRP